MVKNLISCSQFFIKHCFFKNTIIQIHTREVYYPFIEKEKNETKDMSFSQKWKYIVEDAESLEKVNARVREFILEVAKENQGKIILAFGHKASCIKVPCMAALAEIGIDYRDPPFKDPLNGSTAVFEVDVMKEKINLIAIEGFTFSFLAN